MTTGEIVQTLEDSFMTNDLANLSWSPDCHTLFATANGDAVLWDALKGGRIAKFTQITPKNPPYWNPGHEALILEAYGGSYLWNFRQADPILLTFDGEFCPKQGYRQFYWQVEWDNVRNQVLVVPNYVDGQGVIAYNQTNARQIAFFDNACQQAPLKFALTPNGQKVIVFTSESESYAGYDKAITVWDRATMQHVTVDANSQSAVTPSQIALSPDGRTLVLARLGAMRVWDLTQLADDIQQRDPIHRWPIEMTTGSVRFVSATVVETIDLYGKSRRWDVINGAQVG